ncbi:hypothetical protein M6B38_311180 [Iris pallida]|uniref:Uncharacterized protein n=1 Tax=Iris pallida TaxID=29817 RepID=A0AAX6HGX2_IRIPA|nr:hypothetical protein M6B38_311180 [Iris pallida]
MDRISAVVACGGSDPDELSEQIRTVISGLARSESKVLLLLEWRWRLATLASGSRSSSRHRSVAMTT